MIVESIQWHRKKRARNGKEKSGWHSRNKLTVSIAAGDAVKKEFIKWKAFVSSLEGKITF